MSIATDLRPARSLDTSARSGERSPKAMVFLVLLWLTMLIAMTVLLVLIVNTFIEGASRLDCGCSPSTRPRRQLGPARGRRFSAPSG